MRVLAFVVVLAGSIGAATAAPVVRGYEHQPALVLDVGRSLRRTPLTRKAARGYDLRALRPIEKARLDARRILLASKLTKMEAYSRLVAIVRQRLPDEKTASYDSFTAGKSTMSLAASVAKHVGICRERAFLLSSMLKEGGVEAHVRYGKLYENGEDLGGHAWVEARVGGTILRLDPNMPSPITVDPQKVFVREAQLDGSMRGVHASAGSGSLLYLPTKDLHFVH